MVHELPNGHSSEQKVINIWVFYVVGRTRVLPFSIVDNAIFGLITALHALQLIRRLYPFSYILMGELSKYAFNVETDNLI